VIDNRRIFKHILILAIIVLFSCSGDQGISIWAVVDPNSLLVFEVQADRVIDPSIDRILHRRNSPVFLASVQKKSKDDLDLLFSFEMEQAVFDSLIQSSIDKTKNEKLSNRSFNGFEIFEIKPERGEVRLALAKIKNVVALSRSPLLIENAIRIQKEDAKSYRLFNQSLFQFTQLKSDDGNLYFNSQSFIGFNPKIIQLTNSIPVFRNWQLKSVYDVRSENDFLVLNGFAVKDSSLTNFQLQKPGALSIARYVPNFSPALLHFVFSKKESKDANGFIGELAFSNRDDNNRLTGYIRSDRESLFPLDFPSEFVEEYSEYVIRRFDNDPFNKKFHPVYPSNSFEYFTMKDDIILLTETMEDLKELIDSIEAENTWGMSPDFQKYYQRCLLESNISIFLRQPELLAPQSSLATRYPDLIKKLRLDKVAWASLQFSALDKNFYSNINLQFVNEQMRLSEARGKTGQLISLPASATGFFIVRNHASGEREFLLQDVENNLLLLSANNGTLWSRMLDGPLISPVEQIDFFKNGKLQYLVITTKTIYVIDRLGRDVTTFPKPMDEPLRFSTLVDYDKSKNYRFLLATQTNKALLLDKSGVNIDEWGPKQHTVAIALPPEQFRISGSDYFMIVLTDGKVYLYSRRGESLRVIQPGKNLFSGDYFIEKGTNQSNSYICTTTADGLVTKYNLAGKPVNSFSLPKGRQSTFYLKRSTDGKQFYFVRMDPDRISAFTAGGALMFERQNPGALKTEVQIYQKSKQTILFCFYDPEQNISYVFDQSGNEVIPPLDSDIAPLFISGNAGKDVCIYSISGKTALINCLP
jgi:DNA-binding beta-propeller fold protein YncE